MQLICAYVFGICNETDFLMMMSRLIFENSKVYITHKHTFTSDWAQTHSLSHSCRRTYTQFDGPYHGTIALLLQLLHTEF